MTSTTCVICGRNDCKISLVNGHNSDSINNKREMFYSGKCVCCGNVHILREIVEKKDSPKGISTRDLLGCLRRHTTIREQNEILYINSIRTLDDLKDGVIIPSSPLDQVYMLIDYIGSKQKSLSERVRLDSDKDFPVCFAINELDLCFIINSAYELGYLVGRKDDSNPISKNTRNFILSDPFVRLTFKGWEKYEDLKKISPYSKQVFVAFHFDKDGAMKSVYNEAISPAVSECGLVPYVSLDDEHGDSITDVIIAGIRKSRFIIADVTEASQNVYYEAGFAYGLGIPVILTCREHRAKDDMKFDTSHIKHILWKDEEDLKKKLINRIEAMGLSSFKLQ